MPGSPRHSHAHFAYFSLVSACSFLRACGLTNVLVQIKGERNSTDPNMCVRFSLHTGCGPCEETYMLSWLLHCVDLQLCTGAGLGRGTHFFVFWTLVGSGCTILSCASRPRCISDLLVCFGVFLVWRRLRQQGVSAEPICDSASSGCTMLLMRMVASGYF